uniref:Alternative protein NIPA1 n=1 Tax=Homo sapiens TaxID=9606 RepID=L0R6L6_HUMAN|nr:alternative protein NIPA1 [Homo sapiens]
MGPPTSWSTSASAPCWAVSPCLPPRASGWRPKTSCITTRPVREPSACAWYSWPCSAAASSSSSGTSTRRWSASTPRCSGPSTTSCLPRWSCWPQPSSSGSGATWAWWTSWGWPVDSRPSPWGLSLYRCSKSSISTLGR